MKFEHSLHGYRNGHRLLAASIDLPRDAQRIVASQSDYSGRTPLSDEDSYLCGYPLHYDGLYAIARTWHATELSRPGCVWTHTIFLSERDLGAIDILSLAFWLHRRPAKIIPDEFFEEKLIAEPCEGEKASVLSEAELDAFSRLVFYLFSDETLPLLSLKEDFVSAEAASLMCMLFQSPALRSTFTFCTHSISPRKVHDQSFDLQFVPSKSMRAVSRAMEVKHFVGDTFPNGPIEKLPPLFKSWLMKRGVTQTAHEVQKVSIKCPPARCLFETIAEFALHDQHDARSLVNAFAGVSNSRGTSPNAAKCIIEELLRFEATSPFGVARNLLCSEVCSSKNAHLFNDVAQHAETFAAEFAAKDPKSAVDLLSSVFRSGSTRVGVAITRGIVHSLDSNSVAAIVESVADDLPVLVSIAPELVSYKEVWRGSRRQQYEILDALEHSQEDREYVALLAARGILESHSHELARPLVRVLGEQVLSAVLSWFDSSNYQTHMPFPRKWIYELRDGHSWLIQWIENRNSILRIPTIGVLSDVLSPMSHDLQSIGCSYWSDCWIQRHDGVADETLDRVANFFLAIALRGQGEDCSLLASQTFERVHQVIMDRELGYEEWTWISSELPSLGVAWNWDRANRLRIGFLERFVSGNWNMQNFADSVSDDNIWSLLIDSLSHVIGGADFASKLMKKASEGKIDLSIEKRAILQNFRYY
tara:strand:- start:543 stop:2651 length:2109 start_codon:yes stop_codon:yes gene_type:complete